MEKRILILYITNLSGHYKAAKAIEKSLKILDRECKVFCLDILKLLHPYSSRIINSLYSLVIKKIPFLWRNAYDKNIVVEGLNPLKNFIHFLNSKRIGALIEKMNPQAVVCTQAFPCGIVSFFKRNKNKNFLLLGVITDFWPNGFWFYKNIDYYVIPFDWCRGRFRQAGIEEEKIKTLGIPIMPDFSIEFDKNKVSSEFNLRDDLPGILIMGGGSGIGPLKQVALLLDESNLDFQMIVVCGKNKKLYRWFSNQRFKKPLRVFPYIEEVYKLMNFSDIIITKPGGISICESLAKGLAIVVFKPIPGQEENNLKFLLKENLVLKASNPKEVFFLTEDLLKNKDKLKRIQERSLFFSKPNASLEIAKLILNNIND